MNKNIIIITAYNKPDLLYLYLEQIYSNDFIDNYIIQIHTEEGYLSDQDLVINFFKNKNPNVTIQRFIKQKNPNHQLVGFYNILSSYLIAANTANYLNSSYVIIGEEDMIPTKDYLRFNDYIYNHYLSKYPRIIGAAHKRRPEVELDGDAELLIGDYQCTSLSVISVEAINKYLAPFLHQEFLYEYPIEFYKKNFPNSRISLNEVVHHDGCIERIIDLYKLFVLKPDQARSIHVGLSGIYCKGNPPQGNLYERIEQWRELIKDGDKIRALSTNPGDIVVTDLEGPKWEKLELDYERNKARASSWWYDRNNEFKKYITNE